MSAPMPMPAATLPASIGPWTWKYACDRVWASRVGINVWASPDSTIQLEMANSIAATRTMSARLEPVVLGAVGMIQGSFGEYVVLNGGVYDWDLISIARIQWPEATWYAAPGTVARRLIDGFAAGGAVARVGGIMVAAVGPVAALPEEVI